MKKFLIAILILLFVGVGSIVFITTNDSFLKKAAIELQTKFMKDLNLDWKKFEITSNTTSISTRDIRVKTKDSCIEYQKSKFCFKLIDLSVAINLFNPLDTKINKFHINMTDSYFKPEPVKDAPPLALNINELIKNLNTYLLLLKDYVPKDLSINIDKLQVQENQTVVAKVNKEEILILYENDTTKLNINLARHLYGFNGDLSYVANGLIYKSKLSIQVKDSFYITATSNLIHPKLKGPLSFELTSQITKKSFQFTLNKIKALFDQEIELNSAACIIDHDYRESLDFKCNNINIDIKKKFSILAKIDIEILSNIDFSKQSDLAKIRFETKNSNKDILDFLLRSDLTVKNNTGILSYEINRFNWKLYTDQFSKLVDLLKGSEFAIPAPINTMKGRIDLLSEQLVDLKDSYIKVPFKGRINLADSKKNILDFDIDSSLYYSTTLKPKLDGVVSITQININLPPIDPIGGIPNITNSSRIKERITIKRPEKKSSLIYDIKITSKSKESLKLYYYLFDPYFAFSVDARIKNNYISYKIKADKDFDINYLKRSITFDKMTLKSLADDDSSLDAEFNYKISGYKIILKVIGTIDSPKLILKSYPSLPREDIISLLIFKRKSTTITANQKQSVGGTEAAIADQALSLFSIWAFASTPIDYVSYNPEQKTYSASISLPGNTSFQIGTNWESINNLTLRKQLSETWAIETSYNPNNENSKQNLMLQKEINF